MILPIHFAISICHSAKGLNEVVHLKCLLPCRTHIAHYTVARIGCLSFSFFPGVSTQLFQPQPLGGQTWEWPRPRSWNNGIGTCY